jgi:PAS domain S-box-containing protein
MNYEDMTGEQFLDKIEEMFPLFEGLEKIESTDERGQNDLKTVTLSILDSIPHAVIGLRDRKIIFANHAVELVFGWKVEELIGKNTRVFYRSDEEYEEIAGHAYPALERQRTYSREFNCRHKDGRDIVCLVSSSRVGEILKDRMIVVTYSDITEQKRAEESLRDHEVHLEKLVEERTTELKKTASLLQQEVIERKDGEERLIRARARLLTVLDGLNASVYVVDMETYEVLYINKHMKDLFGDVTGKICWQSILNQQGPCDFCVEERLLTPEAGPSGVNVWEQYHAALGIWILIQDQVIQWIDGRMVRLKIATDISKRKLAEQAVHKIQIQQKAILDNIPDMAWLKDRDSRYIAVNEAFGKACGLKPEDVVGLVDLDIWPAELAERYREDDKKVIECGTRKQVEEPLIEKDGKEIWMETIKTPIYDDGDRIIGTAGIARDITRRKHAEEKVKKRERELEANTRNLEEVNIALKVLLKRREEDKSELEEKVLSNVKALIEPYFDKLKKTRLSSDQMTYVNIIETHINDIVSPFLRELTSKYLNLTPREIQIANLIKEGKTTKEIAELLNSSQGAVDFHRNNIRNKLHLKNKKTNLRSYLLSLS